MKIGRAFKKIARNISKLPKAIAKSPLKALTATAFSPLAAVKNSLGLKGLPKLLSSRPLAFLRPIAKPLNQVLNQAHIGDFLNQTLKLKEQSSSSKLDQVTQMFQLISQLQTMQVGRATTEPRW